MISVRMRPFEVNPQGWKLYIASHYEITEVTSIPEEVASYQDVLERVNGRNCIGFILGAETELHDFLTLLELIRRNSQDES